MKKMIIDEKAIEIDTSRYLILVHHSFKYINGLKS